MKKTTPQLIVGAILLFHMVITIHAFYMMFSDYNFWTLQHWHPVALLVFSILWVGIFFKQRFFAFLYFSITFLELMIKLFFGRYAFGEVFGDVLFPADVLFAFLILFLYKQYFGERSARPNSTLH